MKKKILLAGLLAIFATTSCKNLVEGFDKSPNAATDVNVELMVTGVQLNYAFVHEGQLARLGSIFSDYLVGADRQFVNFDQYNVVASDFDGEWADIYAGVLAQARLMQEKAQKEAKPGVEAVAKVLEASVMGTAAALWGDVPFSQAAKIDQYPEPVYDSQADVYAGVQALLDDALNLIAQDANGTLQALGSKDIFYGGDANKWIELIHSLKARYYLHVKDYDNAFLEAQQGISTPDNDFKIDHGQVYGGNFNAYFSFLVYDRDSYISASNVTPLVLLGERINAAGGARNGVTRPASESEFGRSGFFYFDPYFWGDPIDEAEPNYLDDEQFGGGGNSLPLEGFFAADNPFPLMTYAETRLIEAEAALLKSSPDATAALNALNAHRNMYCNYLANPNTGTASFFQSFCNYPLFTSGDFTDDAALLGEIMEEKYLTLIGQIEGFNDLRRWLNETKTVAGQQVKDLVPPVRIKGNSTTIPQRYLYPQTEINTNSNVPAQSPSDLFVPTPVNQ